MKGRLCLAVATGLICGNLFADTSRFTRITDEWRDPVFRQYDFWLGLYHANWRQKKPESFFPEDQGVLGTHWLYPVLSGKAILEFAMSDEDNPKTGTRNQGFSVRYFDTRKERWVMAQEWPGRNATAGVSDQLQGFYRFGRLQVLSTFWAGDPARERTRRYTFGDIRPEGFHWHGTSTGDNGETWTAGTLVEFSRVRTVAEWPDAGAPFPNYNDGEHCDEKTFRAFDALSGSWRGTVTRDGQQKAAMLTGYPMLGGCALISFLEFEDGDQPLTVMEVRSPSVNKTDWWVYRLDSRHGTPHEYQVGNFENGRITLFDNNQFVIQGELENHTPGRIERNDAAARKKTVWQRLDDRRLSFEWWTRSSADAGWSKLASFELRRASSEAPR